MAHKKYAKQILDKKYSFIPDILILEIIKKNGSIPQAKIQQLISKKIKPRELSRMGLWKILNKLEKKGEIEKSFSNGVYVYIVSPKSKILAEFNGIAFSGMFKDGMSKRYEDLLNEFESSKSKKTKLDSLLQFFGFIVLGSLLASRLYDKKLRSDWLRPVLDLEKYQSMSTFFEGIVHEDKLVYIVKELAEKYPENLWTLKEALKATKSMKELVESKGQGFEKMFKTVIDKMNESPNQLGK